AAAEVETSERSLVPDQLALAASRADGQNGRGYQRRGAVMHTRSKDPSPDYTYGQLELNLIRPEHETSSMSPHSKLGTYYGLSTTVESAGAAAGAGMGAAAAVAVDTTHEKTGALEDSETAAEYVANAMKLAYGTRHKEQAQSSLRAVASTQRPYSAALLLAEQQQQQHLQLQQQQQQLQQQQQQLQQQQHQQQQHLHQQQQQFTVDAGSERSPPAPAPVYEKESVPRSYEIYEAPAQASVQSQSTAGAAPAGAAAAAGGDIERLYRTKYPNYSGHSSSHSSHLYRNLEADAEEKVRVSASTEIPKAEIMKQIEKSVIKYMRELEAEGKIITTPQELAPPATKTYYKLLSLPASSGGSTSLVDDKRYSGSTVRPKYSGAASGGQSRQPSPYQSMQSQSQAQPLSTSAQHHQMGKPGSKGQRYQSETETAYQAPDLPADALAPNVEFIYKIKTRAPLQTATVKTVSKPYTLPLKSSAEHFDHGAALKNIEEFDLSHVVTTPERELEQEQPQRVTTKPQKLYFNSEIYHDINSLPYKPEKLRGSSQMHTVQSAPEYRHKLKTSTDLHPDYKGYSGYFAEPAASSLESLAEKQPLGALADSDEASEEAGGYPLPYQYVLKKEPLSSKYEEERESWEQSMRLAHAKPATGAGSGGSGGYKLTAGASSASLDYDSYSPKFNNNPEGYGYQHTYKTQLHRGAGAGGGGSSGQLSSNGQAVKRGKRGGAAHPPAGGGGALSGKKLLRAGGVGGKLIKDLEANLALRPPPP
ncbi:hypothetical protein KR222_005716, partial [Zaprionus bogoriensis]